MKEQQTVAHTSNVCTATVTEQTCHCQLAPEGANKCQQSPASCTCSLLISEAWILLARLAVVSWDLTLLASSPCSPLLAPTPVGVPT